MRGKVADPVAKNQAARITPAYAGKSEKARNCVIFTGDHPRLCGEKKYIASVKDGDQGSPPPMRGKVHPLYLVPERCRITPAYAGKRQASSELLLSCRDHPRLCGEKRCHARCLMRRLGSPPPMRGKGIFPKKSQQKDGITPAYAGKRPPPLPTASSHEDHPRLCGEKYRVIALGVPSRGSPPPMRGKVLQEWQHLRCMGITPAYAGKSSCRM